MESVAYRHITIWPNGVPVIEGTRIKIIMLIEAHIAAGGGAEEVQKHYPMVSLAQIYGALTYYYDHKTEMDALIEQRRIELDEMQRQSANSPATRRLRALKAKMQGQNP